MEIVIVKIKEHRKLKLKFATYLLRLDWIVFVYTHTHHISQVAQKKKKKKKVTI